LISFVKKDRKVSHLFRIKTGTIAWLRRMAVDPAHQVSFSFFAEKGILELFMNLNT
jgi:hypothetical protein